MSKRDASQRADDLWSDSSPAIAGPREFTVVGDCEQFVLRLKDVDIAFELDRPRFDHGELLGELTVRCGLQGARSYDGILSVGSLNCSSPTARKTRASLLQELSRAPQIDWARLMEEFTVRVLTAVRTGGAAVDLRTVTPASEADTIDVHGIRIFDRHPIILFGDGASGKSFIALYIAGELGKRGVRVLFADWELGPEDHRHRYGRLFGAEMPELLYVRCSRPMTVEGDRLRRLVRQHQIAYLVCDSVAFACDGRPEDAEVSVRYFQALRQIDVGSLNIAHTNKSDESDKKPFGSSFWHNGARATWNVKRSSAEGTLPTEVTVGCFNRKANLGALQPAVGFTLSFNEDRTLISRTDLAHVDDLAAGLPLRQRIRTSVSRQPQTLATLAEELRANVESISRTVRRHPTIFTRVAGSDGIERIGLVERRSGE